MTNDEAFQLIVKVLQNTPDLKSKVAHQNLNPQTQFRRDMGFDSLVMAAFFYELQDSYPLLQEEWAAQWITLGDCALTLTKI